MTVYFFIIIAIRISGRKELAQLSVIDLAFILLISNAVQNAMVGPNTSLLGGLVAASTLFIVNFILKQLLYRYTNLSKLIQGQEIMLIYNGALNEKNLKRARMSVSEIIDIKDFKKAVNLLISEFPLIGCKFSESGKHSFWEDARFTSEDIVFLNKTQDINEKIQKAFGPKIDELSEPQLRIHIIRTAKEDTLCININHMLCDGEGYRDLIYRLGFIYYWLYKI